MTTSGSNPGGIIDLNGRRLSRMGYGMGSLGRASDSSDDRQKSVNLLQRALELGVQMFDTAHFYGAGHSNSLLAEAFADRRDDVFLATKVGARVVTGGKVPMAAAQKPRELRESVEANLESLKTDYLDLVYMRRMDFKPGLVVDEVQSVPLEDQLTELISLREEGKIRGIGLSHVTPEQVESALPAGILAVQNIYNLLDRHDERLLELTCAHGAAWIPYFPLGGGGEFFGLPRVTEDGGVVDVARELGATPQQVGLAWLLTHSSNTMVISGTSSVEHLEENLAAGALALTPEMLERLEG
ncbi:aldo/keto reductase [Kocuria sp. TGY1127_2]|uniref:aldo/keto reductase n=1 Tax=Kocuria sp. TGY1127_2 TaxID=2711328 RepID=UPI0015BFA181|nr:aldo/keto reductase [Kocuria sp. TGY1127_2]